MLEELKHKGEIQYYDGDALFTLLPQAQVTSFQEDEFCGELAPSLSPSRLKVFLECPRKYFYLYEEKMSGESNSNASMGNILHECLQNVYRRFVGRVGLEAEELYQEALKWFETYEIQSASQKAEIEWLKCELKKFFEADAPMGNKIEILALEQEMVYECEGFRFKLRADRIQKVGERLEVIDYKYRGSFKLQKKQENTTDYALVLYALAVKDLYPQYVGLDVSAWYWDVRGGERVQEDIAKQEWLTQILAGLKGQVVFDKTQNRALCRYCDFTALCDRG